MLSGGRLIGFGAAGEAAVTTYRYLRMRQTANVGADNYMILWSLQYSNDGGTTWYPTSNMTGNSAPSPLVASADTETGGGYEAYRAFDGNAGTRFTSGAGAHPHYLSLDLGAGNGILPNRVRFGIANLSPDRTPKDFTILGSNTGSFAGEETTLLTVTGAASGGADGTIVTYTIP